MVIGNFVFFFQLIFEGFREMKPMKLLLESLTKSVDEKGQLFWLSLSFQELIVSKILNDPISRKYPPSTSFKRAFVNNYLQQLEIHRVVRYF